MTAIAISELSTPEDEHHLTVVPSTAGMSSWYETPLGRLAYPSGPPPSTETPAETVRRVVADLMS
jgi:hypothetical protein